MHTLCKCKTDSVMSEFLSEDLKVTNDRMLKYCEVNSQSYMDGIQIQIHPARKYNLAEINGSLCIPACANSTWTLDDLFIALDIANNWIFGH